MRGTCPTYARRLVHAATLWLCFYSAGSARSAGLVQTTLCPANCKKHHHDFPKASHKAGCCGPPSALPPASPTRLSLRGGSASVAAAAAGGTAGAACRSEAQQQGVARMPRGDAQHGAQAPSDGKRGMGSPQPAASTGVASKVTAVISHENRPSLCTKPHTPDAN